MVPGPGGSGDSGSSGGSCSCLELVGLGSDFSRGTSSSTCSGSFTAGGRGLVLAKESLLLCPLRGLGLGRLEITGLGQVSVSILDVGRSDTLVKPSMERSQIQPSLSTEGEGASSAGSSSCASKAKVFMSSSSSRLAFSITASLLWKTFSWARV